MSEESKDGVGAGEEQKPARKPRTVKNKTLLVGGVWRLEDRGEDNASYSFVPHAQQPNPPTNDLGKAVAFFRKNVLGATQFIRKLPGTLTTEEAKRIVSKFG